MKRNGVFVGAILAVFVFVLMMMQAAAFNAATNCYQRPVNLAGNLTSDDDTLSPNGNTPLFNEFQSAPTFSDADRAEQRKNAAAIVTIGESRPENLSDRDIGIALKTAIQ